MAIIYQQNFEGLSIGADMTAHGYTYYQYPGSTGTFKVIAGKYGETKVTAGTWGGGHHLDQGAAWTDYKVTTKTISWASGRYIRAVRANTTLNKAYWIQVQPGNPGSELIIFKGALDYPTGALSVASAIPPGTSGVLRIECVSNNIKVYIDDTLYIDYTDDGSIGGPAILSGTTGVSSFQSGSVWDDIEVDDFSIVPEPPEPPIDITAELKEYYKNLLIIQYNGKPKAAATIELILETLIANELYFDVRNGFDIDTAVDAQLDILDKYIGVGRGNKGTLLDDDEYRFLMKMKIIQNNSNHSTTSINESLDAFFDDDVTMHSDGGMVLTYYVKTALKDTALLAFEKGVLPSPMGVKIILIEVYEEPFAFLEYVAIGAETPAGFDDLLDPGNGGILSDIIAE